MSEVGRVRLAKPNDSRRIHDLIQAEFRQFGDYQQYLSEWAEVQGVTTWVVPSGDELDGFLMGAFMREHNAAAPRAYIIAVSVRHQVRRQGIAQHLMTAFLQWGRSYGHRLGAKEFALDVAADNLVAHSFFLSLGFQEAPHQKQNVTRKYPRGQSVISMTLPI